MVEIDPLADTQQAWRIQTAVRWIAPASARPSVDLGKFATNFLAAVTPATFVAFLEWLRDVAVTLAWPTFRRAATAPRGTLSRRSQELGFQDCRSRG